MIQIVIRNFDLLKLFLIQIVISHKESYFVKLIKAMSEFESLGLKRLGKGTMLLRDQQRQ